LRSSGPWREKLGAMSRASEREAGVGGPFEAKACRITGWDGWMAAAKIQSPGCNEPMIRREVINNPKAVAANLCFHAAEVALVMEDAFEATIEKAEDAHERLKDVLSAFRSQAKNEMASVSALGDRVRSEVTKITRAAESAAALFGTKEVVTAVEMAERLAAALEQIERLKSTRMLFAIVDQKPPNEGEP
jgi:hypothetical protein